MILDRLDNAASYTRLGERFERGLQYLRDFDPATPVGRYEIDGERLFAMVQEVQTAPASERRMEAHRRYADIQYVAAGRETIVYAPLNGAAPATDYNPEKDVVFFGDLPGATTLHMEKGFFAIFLPQDGHIPCCAWGDPAPVRKVVIKVLLEG